MHDRNANVKLKIVNTRFIAFYIIMCVVHTYFLLCCSFELLGNENLPLVCLGPCVESLFLYLFRFQRFDSMTPILICLHAHCANSILIRILVNNQTVTRLPQPKVNRNLNTEIKSSSFSLHVKSKTNLFANTENWNACNSHPPRCTLSFTKQENREIHKIK